MPSRADELFKLLRDRGEAAIDDFIAQGASEELFLDFKRSASNGGGLRLDPKDRSNIAKAVSGFGNSEGGVVVWGVDCRTNVDGADVPNGKVPLENPVRFRSWLEGATSGLTVPPHGGVVHIAMPIGDGRLGFVASLIPKSDHAPHQNVIDSRYMIRAGSNFLPVPHSVLAGMFGRRPQPRIIYKFVVDPPEPFENDGVRLQLGILLRNIGQGIAEHMFLNLNIWSAGSARCTIRINPANSDRWSGEWVFGQFLSLIALDGVRLAPMGQIMPTSLEVVLLPPFDRKLRVTGECGGAGAETIPILIDTAPAELAAGVALFRERLASGTSPYEAGPLITDKLIRPVD